MGVTTSDRLLNILGLFTMERPEWPVEQAAQELGLAVSTAYRYFRSLSKAGLIVSFAAGRYVLGPAIIQYDRQIRLLDPLMTTAQPIMRRLAAQISPQVIILLCRLFRNQVMCVHQESGEHTHSATSYERGRPMPLFRGAASKIILANMPSRIVSSLYATLAPEFKQAGLGGNWEEVKVKLRALRNAGASITQGELDLGMAGLSVPVFDQSAAVIGSLGIVIEAHRLTPKLVATVTAQLHEASQQITWALSILATGHAATLPRDITRGRRKGRSKSDDRPSTDVEHLPRR